MILLCIVYLYVLGGQASNSKKIRGKQKLYSATKAIKGKLEISYDVSITSDEDLPEHSNKLEDMSHL